MEKQFEVVANPEVKKRLKILRSVKEQTSANQETKQYFRRNTKKEGNCFVLIAFSRSLSNYEKSGYGYRDYHGDYSEGHVNHSARCDC